MPPELEEMASTQIPGGKYYAVLLEISSPFQQ